MLAVPKRLEARLSDLECSIISLPDQPFVGHGGSYSRSKQKSDRAETALFLEVSRTASPDHALHLFGDSAMRWLLKQPVSDVPISVLLFRPRAHYPALYGTRFNLRERFLAAAHEHLVQRWGRRTDAHALLTLDEGAAHFWAERGLQAHWLPEPPIGEVPAPVPRGRRKGCIAYGALAERKGIEFLAAASIREPDSIAVTLAGPVEPGFERRLEVCVAQMKTAGVEVDVRTSRHSEAEGLAALASARCAVLPYPRHYGMSRVLLEAASVGTPVIVQDGGLMGYLVRRYELGIALECTDAPALARAIRSLTDDPDAVEARSEALAQFADRFSRERFRRAFLAAFPSAPEVSQGVAAGGRQ